MTRARTALGWSALAATVGLLLFWGALGFVLRAGTPAAPTPAQTERSARLAATLAELTAQNGRRSHAEQWTTAKLISARFAALGYRTHIEEYSRGAEHWPDVVAVDDAPAMQRDAILLTAHLDSISGDPQGRAPGADDNGSGIAVLLELARTLHERRASPSVIFAVFSNEETDRSDSRAFAARLRREGVKLRAVINVDVVGYPRPRRLLDWQAFAVHRTWRGRLQALREQLGNAFLALRHGPGALLVAGRIRDRALVTQVAGGLAAGSGLEVVARARDDCG